MSRRSRFMSGAAAALAFAALSPVVLAAQQDSSMMSHEETGMMKHDTGMMSQDTGMMQHDTGMMKHDDAMDEAGNTFSGAAGQPASGGYAIGESGGKRQLRLDPRFAVAAAPDLYLVLAHGPTPEGAALYLGKLERASGAQAFDLPKGKDLTGYTTLLVWSKKEKRAVATAEWRAPSDKAMNQM